MKGYSYDKKVFNQCVRILNCTAKKLGVSYEARNVWIFVIIWPAVTIILLIALLKK
jgi:hypothetical protein